MYIIFNGSKYMKIDHHRCVVTNECVIIDSYSYEKVRALNI